MFCCKHTPTIISDALSSNVIDLKPGSILGGFKKIVLEWSSSISAKAWSFQVALRNLELLWAIKKVSIYLLDTVFRIQTFPVI